MKLKFLANLALSLCLVAQLNFASAAKDYDEEITLPVGTNFDLEMEEITRYEYDGNFVDAKTVDGKEQIILKKTGDTIITVIMEEDGQKTEMKVLVHIVTDQQFDSPKTTTATTPDIKQPTAPNTVTANTPTPATKKPNKVITKKGTANDKKVKQPNKIIKIQPSTDKPAEIPQEAEPSSDQQTAAPVEAKTEVTSVPAPTFQIYGTPTSRPADVTPANTIEAARLKTQNLCFDVLDLVNAERTQAGLTPLTMTKDLADAALVRAKELPKRFSHTRPDNTRYFTALSNRGNATEENIAAGQTSASAVHKAWMAAPNSKSIILNPNFKEIGIGYFETISADFPCYWVQIFRG